MNLYQKVLVFMLLRYVYLNFDVNEVQTFKVLAKVIKSKI